VGDHCRAILTVIREGTIGETYNVGGDNQPANLTVVQTLCEILDERRPGSPFAPHASLVQYVPDRPGHDRRYAMDISKIKAELGWQPVQSLETGLFQTIEWYLAHPEWVEAIHQQTDYQSWLERNYAARGGQA
jgi:dTDP-glucose 4,6-dehydratase